MATVVFKVYVAGLSGNQLLIFYYSAKEADARAFFKTIKNNGFVQMYFTLTILFIVD